MIMTWWPTPWTAAWLILRPISRLTPWLIKDPMTEPWVSEWRNPLMTPWLTPRLIPWSTPRLTDIVMFLCRRAILCNGPGAKRHKFQHPEGSSLREPWNYCFWKVEKQQFTAISPFGEEVLKHRGHFRSHNTCIRLLKCIVQCDLFFYIGHTCQDPVSGGDVELGGTSVSGKAKTACHCLPPAASYFPSSSITMVMITN